jgi:prepilin-type N-terminal cleavage/methylation domain-containing protein
MKFHFKDISNTRPGVLHKGYKLCSIKPKAFSLIEVLAALVILAFVASSVMIVIDRSLCAASDSELQMQAFETARENLELLLCKTTVELTSEYGISSKYPGIRWQTVVETFFEPITAMMWLRGVCRADYTNSKNQTQTVELSNWICGLSNMELLQVMWQQEANKTTDQLLNSIEQAAAYAAVDVNTIEQWLNNDLCVTEDGAFVKSNLDLYKQTDGNPSRQQKDAQVQSLSDLQSLQKQQNWRSQKDPRTGLTYGELEKMNIADILSAIGSKGQ